MPRLLFLFPRAWRRQRSARTVLPTLVRQPLCGALLCGVLLACISTEAPAQAPAPADAAPLLVHEGGRVRIPLRSPLRSRVQVAPVATERAAHTVSVPGVIEADPAHTVNLLPPVAGRLTELQVRLGDQVSAGAVLGRMQSPDLLQAAADLVRARDAQALAAKARERARQVNAAGGNALKDLEQADSTLAQAQAELDRAAARMQVLGADADGPAGTASLALRAPISGTVTALALGQGALLNDLTAPILTIANLDQVFVNAQVPEHDLARLRVGQEMTVVTAAWPDRPLRGRVASIAAALDATTRRTAVRARFDNPGHWLRPNMFASVALEVSLPPQPVVPSSALVMSNDRVLVFVEVQPLVYEPRQVELGMEEGDRVRIRRGLQAGERVVVRGGVLLND